MTEVILQVTHPEDIALLIQLAERLGIPYTMREVPEKKSLAHKPETPPQTTTSHK